ncbi:hypothetical protein JAAARDRAFT_45167 [Jaapia argillacea MUCL 33604]|uniref:RanBP2-type domain-containing protein n=1 Tax=Jaapia argillacea MUCL 33604 TaxID=933084 RepID=A0A067QG23_9AGAM|nr:hypothetical protein JAAARDRAFT_45167 [Jaapia argillacea MUCL 33604]
MSAVRNTNRSVLRSRNASPYSRPGQTKKKSSWSITGLFSFLNPLRARTPHESASPESTSEPADDQEEFEEEEQRYPVDPESPTENHPAEALAQVGHQMARTLSISTPTPGPAMRARNRPLTHVALHPALPANAPFVPNFAPAQPAALPPPPPPPTFHTPQPPPPQAAPLASSPESDTSGSPSKNIETVIQFLSENSGRQLNKIEIAGLVSLLQDSSNDADRPEPFRFSTSPGRGTTPPFGFGTPGSSTNGASTSNASTSKIPRRTLSKNPNGVYKWQGGGSARPKNRYQSPSFGSPRGSPSKLKLSPPAGSAATTKTDGKRRRVGEDAESSVPFPTASSSHAEPSGVSSSSSSSSSLAMPNGTSTNGASAPKVNGAPPVTPRLRTTGIAMKPTAPAIPSPLRQAWGQSDSPSPPHPPPHKQPTKAANFMTELIKEVTPPKKPDLSNPYQTASPVKQQPQHKKPVTRKVTRVASKAKEAATMEVDKKVELPPLTAQAIIEATVPKGSKRARAPPDLEKSKSRESTSTSPPRRSPRLRSPSPSPPKGMNGNTTVTVEEVSDEDDSRATKKAKTRVNGVVPKAPSPPQVITIEEVDDVDMASYTKATEVIEPETLSPSPTPPPRKSPQASSAPTNFFAPSSQPSRPAFGLKSTAPKEPSKLRFGYSVEKEDPAPSMVVDEVVKTELDPKAAALAMGVDSLPVFTFTFTATAPMYGFVDEQKAVKALSVSELPTFDFSASPKEFVPTPSPAPAPAPPAASGGFNWAAAGLKAPTKPAGWSCSTCMCSNPEAANKCTVCDTPR